MSEKTYYIVKLTKALKASEMPTTQAIAALAQAGLECGLFSGNLSKLAKDHLNFWGLKWRKEMAGFAQPVNYAAHDGEEVYCKFDSFAAAAKGYEAFINRSPYAGYEEHLDTVWSFLDFIGPIFCPPGYREKFRRSHGDEVYHQYICNKFYATARQLYMNEQGEEQEEQEEEIFGLSILLDPGHSQRDPGAISPNGRVKEYALNVAQAEYIKNSLKDKCTVDIYDPVGKSLSEIGNKAAGYDLFISLHHNSYSGTGEPGVEAFTPRKFDIHQREFCEKVTRKIAKELGIPDRGHKVANHNVTVAAAKHCDAYLIESHFVNDETSLAVATAKSLKAAAMICEAIEENYFDKVEAEEEEQSKYPRWSGVKTFKKGRNLQLSKNFSTNEFDCKCSSCKVTKIDYLQVQRLQKLRDAYGDPLIVHSAYRCPKHNAAIGGTKNSYHMKGKATDFHIKRWGLQAIKDAVFKLWDGGGIGMYSTFIHTDTGPKRRW